MKRHVTGFVRWIIPLVLVLALSAGARQVLAQAELPQAEPPPEAAVAGCSALAVTGQTSYQAVLPALKDSYVSSILPNTNYGTSTALRVGLVTVPLATTYRTFIAFDLSSLPADAIIVTATLELYQTSSTSSFSMAAQPLTAAWTETGVTSNNQPSSSTQDQAFGAQGADGWVRWNITPIAQKWRSGALANHGVRLVFNMGEPGSKNFSAREAATNQPRLVVAYLRQATLNVQADTQVSQASPSSNFGTASPLYVRRDGIAFNEIHALLRFDVSGVPAGSTVISASLGLFPYFAMAQASPSEAPPSEAQALAPQALSIATEAVLASWNETVVTWNSAPKSASQGDPSKSWLDTQWNWFDVTNIAQAWASGTLSNHGIKLKAALRSTGSVSFEALPNSAKARLVIVYGPPPCYAATSTTIGGATQGIVNTSYAFNASVSPSTVTAPLIYTWQATGQAPTTGATSSVNYTWATTGTKTITVTVENCGSSVMDTHQVIIAELPPACPVPLTGLSLSGPTEVVTGTDYLFTATPSPAGATTPLTYIWQATGHSDYTGSQATRTYTWATTGVKTVTVTAQNCAGEVVQQMTVNVQPRADLLVPGAWYSQSEGRVYYILQNIGGSEAPAGHTARLYRDGVAVADGTFDMTLLPGGVRAGSFAYSWTCATASAQIRVCADVTGLVPEGSETNNCFEETWACDLVAPRIVTGPAVSSITEHGAVIAWTTDEPCRTRLDYGKFAPFGLISVPDSTYKTAHQVTLSGLSNGSTYWYRVYIEDAAGNAANSADAYFETEPPGTDPVVIGGYGLLDYPSALYEFFTLYADVTSDLAGVDHVSFFVDGQLIGRDDSPTGNRFQVYLSPAALGFSRADWFKAHQLQVQAYNLEGEGTALVKSVTPAPRLTSGNAVIVSPGAGYEMIIEGATAPAGTTLDVMAYGVEYIWKCTEGGYTEDGQVPPGLQGVDCGDVRKSVSSMKLYLDGTQVGATYTPPAGDFHHLFNISVAGKGVGTHTLRLVAQLSGGGSVTVERQITLTQGRGELALGHRAERTGNVFQVTLTLTNTGTGTVYVDGIHDYASGFQVIEVTNAAALQVAGIQAAGTPFYKVTSADWGDTADRTIHIDFFASDDPAKMALPPGTSFAITYQLVPILYEGYTHYYIGSGGVSASQASLVTYQVAGVPGSFQKWFAFGDNWVDGLYIDQAVQQAFAAADYVIVTSPAGLRTFTEPVTWRPTLGTKRELNVLLSRMAELAALKNGVIGFLPLSPCGDTLDDMLQRTNGNWGRWAYALHPNFRQNGATGYVLLVGEQEVIPARTANYGVNFSDLPYASTTGDGKPELILGRIVGNDLGTLRNALDTSLRFHRSGAGFDRSHAIGVSGRGRGESIFWDDIKAIAGSMADSGINVTKIRWKVDNTPTAWDYFKTKVAETQPDIIAYSGHGSPDGWYAMWTNQIEELDFGFSRPVAVAFACSTGNYEESGDDYSLPEAWLRYDGSVYIGSSDTTYDYPDSDAARGFFSRWEAGEEGRNVGQVFTYLKRDKWSIDSDWREWVYSYHLFGDPKFGALPVAQVQTVAPAAPQGASTLSLHIPDFEVSLTEDGFDAVEIPGGEIMGEEGAYRIPYWTVSVDYPQGQRVQGVQLTSQSGLVLSTGLHLPTTTMEIRCPGCVTPAQVMTGLSSEGWVPDRPVPYDWQVTENPDGTSTLNLSIYPFSYYPPTTAVRFYQDWEFNVDVAESTVDVVSLGTPRATYRMTDTVAAALILHNSGSAQPVTVRTHLRSGATGEIVATLPLRTLHGVTGTANVELVWAPGSSPAGPYALEVILLDAAGHTLDTEITLFTRGLLEGAITSLTAAQTSFKAGDLVNIAMTLRNTGDVSLSGTAIIRVEAEEGLWVSDTFTETFTSLAPGSSRSFNLEWDSTGAAEGNYRVIGYAQYPPGVSEPRELSITTDALRVFLPFTLRH